jgi:hypothetical protein
MIKVSFSPDCSHVRQDFGKIDLPYYFTCSLMPVIKPVEAKPVSEAAVLLVLLPSLARHPAALSATDVPLLQHHLGTAVQVLRIDEGTYPMVVRSFLPLQLPACVLLRQGVELWRQEQIVSTRQLVPTILDKVRLRNGVLS